MKAMLAYALLFAMLGTGCSGMPRVYRSIEFEKPLDMSLIPPSAIVQEISSSPPSLQIEEYNQSYFPIGLHRYVLNVYRDEKHNVVRLRFEDYSVSYWVLFIAGSTVESERFLDGANKPREKVIHNVPFSLVPPLPNFYVFLMGIHQCFWEASEAHQNAKKSPQIEATTMTATAPNTSVNQ